jgi:hypothetical protein
MIMATNKAMWLVVYRDVNDPDTQLTLQPEITTSGGTTYFSRMTEKEVSDMCVFMRKLKHTKVSYNLIVSLWAA